MRKLYLFVFAAAAVAAAQANAGPVATPDLPAMVLREADVPSGFSSAGGRFWTPRQLAAEGPWTLPQLKAWGYIRGYEVKFTRLSESGRPGQITSAVGSYLTQAGAGRSLAANLVECRKKPWRRLALSASVGDRTYLCRRSANVDGVPVQLHLIVWRIGRFKGSVAVTGVVGQIGASEAVELARRQAERMRCSLGRDRDRVC